MKQPALSFDRDINLPVAGRSPQARHSSASGAIVAARTRGQLSIAYIRLLKEVGARGLSDVEAARALARPISSICSTRNGLGDLIVASGSFEATDYGTKRTRWTVKGSNE